MFKPSTELKTKNYNSNITIKFIIYYILLIDYSNFSPISKLKEPLSLFIKKPIIKKKSKFLPILYSPNRHKTAQKHFKYDIYYITIKILFSNYYDYYSNKYNNYLNKLSFSSIGSLVYIINISKLLINISIINLSINSISFLVTIPFTPKHILT